MYPSIHTHVIELLYNKYVYFYISKVFSNYLTFIIYYYFYFNETHSFPPDLFSVYS